jgi:hypothetical protein
MLALGAYLVVSVVAATPAAPAHVVAASEKLASTYDEAFCDPADGGECADEPAVSEDLPPAAPAILDCESPLIADMIGSCDMPKPTWPQLHVPTLRNGNGSALVVDSGGHDHFRIVTTAPPVDAALFAAPTLTPHSLCDRNTPSCPRTPTPLYTHRLDRPPRA